MIIQYFFIGTLLLTCTNLSAVSHQNPQPSTSRQRGVAADGGRPDNQLPGGSGHNNQQQPVVSASSNSAGNAFITSSTPSSGAGGGSVGSGGAGVSVAAASLMPASVSAGGALDYSGDNLPDQVGDHFLSSPYWQPMKPFFHSFMSVFR